MNLAHLQYAASGKPLRNLVMLLVRADRTRTRFVFIPLDMTLASFRWPADNAILVLTIE